MAVIVLGVDPGPFGGPYGWATVDCGGARPRFVDGEHASYPLSCVYVGNLGLVAIEWPVWSPLPNTPAKEIWCRARDLMPTAIMAGAICAKVEGWGASVVGPATDGHPALTCQEVRRALCGKRRASDAEVKAALQLQCDGLPRRTNNHVRDAIAVAIVGARKWERER